MSASAPAGKVNKAKGRDERVDMREIRMVELLSWPSTEKAAVLWAATQVPETRAASQYPLKTGFLRASQMDVFRLSGRAKPSGEWPISILDHASV